MAKFSGISGNVALTSTSGNWGAGVVVANIRGWTATITQNAVDSTSKGDSGFTTDVRGTQTCEGTITMATDDTTVLLITGTTDPAIELIMTGSARKISGNARLTLLDFAGQTFAPPGELAEVTFSFRMQGSFTVA